MSTGYLMTARLRKVATELGLKLETMDPNNLMADWQVLQGDRLVLFQASIDRCNDFIRGYARAMGRTL